jgi:hypothetical protein
VNGFGLLLGFRPGGDVRGESLMLPCLGEARDTGDFKVLELTGDNMPALELLLNEGLKDDFRLVGDCKAERANAGK